MTSDPGKRSGTNRDRLFPAGRDPTSSRRGVDPSTRRSILAVVLAMVMVASVPATAAVGIGTSTQANGGQQTDLEALSDDRASTGGTSVADRASTGGSGPSVADRPGILTSGPPGTQDNETERENGTFRLEFEQRQPIVAADGVYEVTVVVQNTGPVTDRTNVTLAALDGVRDSQWVTLGPGERREVELTWKPTRIAGQIPWTVRTGDDSIDGLVLVENERAGIEYRDSGLESGSVQPVPTSQIQTADNWGGEPVRQWESPSRPLMVKVDTSSIADNPNAEVKEVKINGGTAQPIVPQRDYRKEIAQGYDSSPANIIVGVDPDQGSGYTLSTRHSWQPHDAEWYSPYRNLVGSRLGENQEWVALGGNWDQGQTDRLSKFGGTGAEFKPVDDELLPHPQCSSMVAVESTVEGSMGAYIGQDPRVEGSLGAGGEVQVNCIFINAEGEGSLVIVPPADLDKATVGLTVEAGREFSTEWDLRVVTAEATFRYGVEAGLTAEFQKLWLPDEGTFTAKGTASVRVALKAGDYGLSGGGEGQIGPKFGFGTGEELITFEGVEGSLTFDVAVEGSWYSWTIYQYSVSGTFSEAQGDGLQEVEQLGLLPGDGFEPLVVKPDSPPATHTRITNRTFDVETPAMTNASAVTDDLAIVTSTQPTNAETYTRNLAQWAFDSDTGTWQAGPQLTNETDRVPRDVAIDGTDETATLVASFDSRPANASAWTYTDYLDDPLSSVGVATHDGTAWGNVTILNPNASTFDRHPDVAVAGSDTLLAYEAYQGPPSRELNPDREAGTVAYHVVENGTVSHEGRIENATGPAVDSIDGTTVLSYYDNETGQLVTGEINGNGAINETGRHDVAGRYLDHAQDGAEYVIATRKKQGIDNVTLQHVDGNGTASELPPVPVSVVSVGDLAFERGDGTAIVSYTGFVENDTDSTDAIRQVRTNGTWGEPVMLSGGPTTTLSASQPSATLVDGEPTVAYVARGEGIGPRPDQENRTTSDLFITGVESSSLLVIGDVERPDDATTGETVPVNVTVRNAGTEPGSAQLQIVSDDGTRLAATNVSLGPRNATTASFGSVEVPKSGTFDVIVDPNASTTAHTGAASGPQPTADQQANWSPWFTRETSVRVARANLSVSTVETQARSVTNGTVTVTVENTGSAFAIDEVVRLEDASGLVSDKTVPDVPPGGNATLSWDVAPADLDLSGQGQITINPDSSMGPDEYVMLFEPDLTPGTVTYHTTGNGTTALFNLNNSGVGAAYDVETTIYRIGTNMTAIGSGSIDELPGRTDRYVALELSNASEWVFQELFVDAWGQPSRSTLYSVPIQEDNFSVDLVEFDDSGDQVTVTANVTNTGTDDSEQAIDLTIDGELRNQTLVSRTSEESSNVTLTANTSDLATLSSVTVSSLDDTDGLRSSFAVNNLTLERTNVSRGEGFNVSVDLANVGELASQQEISLLVNRTAVATRTVQLGSGDGTNVTFRNVTTDLPPRNYEVRVESGDDSAVATLTVGDSQGYACSIADANDEVTTIVLLDAIDDWRADRIPISWLFDVIDDWRASGPLNC